jgi:hypothetical protein
MNYQNKKPSQEKGFIDKAIQEMYGILRDAPTAEERQEVLTYLFRDRLRESFKNGIEVGKKLRNNKSQRYSKKQ